MSLLRPVFSKGLAKTLMANACRHNIGALGMLHGSPTTQSGVNAKYFSTAIRGAVSDGVSSPMEIQQTTPGSVTKRLRVLDMTTVQKIQEELRSVDANSDGM